MTGLNGSSSAASRKGAMASAGRPALSIFVATVSNGATRFVTGGIGALDMLANRRLGYHSLPQSSLSAKFSCRI